MGLVVRPWLMSIVVNDSLWKEPSQAIHALYIITFHTRSFDDHMHQCRALGRRRSGLHGSHSNGIPELECQRIVRSSGTWMGSAKEKRSTQFPVERAMMSDACWHRIKIERNRGIKSSIGSPAPATHYNHHLNQQQPFVHPQWHRREPIDCAVSSAFQSLSLDTSVTLICAPKDQHQSQSVLPFPRHLQSVPATTSLESACRRTDFT